MSKAKKTTLVIVAYLIFSIMPSSPGRAEDPRYQLHDPNIPWYYPVLVGAKVISGNPKTLPKAEFSVALDYNEFLRLIGQPLVAVNSASDPADHMYSLMNWTGGVIARLGGGATSIAFPDSQYNYCFNAAVYIPNITPSSSYLPFEEDIRICVVAPADQIIAVIRYIGEVSVGPNMTTAYAPRPDQAHWIKEELVGKLVKAYAEKSREDQFDKLNVSNLNVLMQGSYNASSNDGVDVDGGIRALNWVKKTFFDNKGSLFTWRLAREYRRTVPDRADDQWFPSKIPAGYR